MVLRQKKKRFSIKHKLIKMSMATSMIAILLTCIVFIIHGAFIAREALVKELSLISKLIANRTASPISSGNKDAAERALRDLRVKESVVLACIFNEDGSVFAKYFPDGKTDCPPMPKKGDYIKGWSILTMHEDIVYQGKFKGSIYMESDLRDIKKELPGYILFTLMIIASISAITWRIASHYQKYIAEPILGLVSTTNDVIKKDNYDVRAKKYDNDEIGDLTTSFNKMMAQVRKERRNLEHNVQERTSQLEEEKIKAEAANKTKSEFLRNMSHEFRTPLHGMLSFSSYGINESETAERSDLLRYFSRINQVAKRLLNLVEAILSIAQMESGKESFNFQKDDIEAVISSVIKEQQALLKQSDISVELTKPDFLTDAEFDRDKMLQVFTNILGNAIKFTPKGKKIAISFEEVMYTRDKRRREMPAIKISITDEGVGIPDDELEKIFDKFVQSSRTNTGAGGTGLGLSIAASIVREHDGEITAKNTKDGGAEFAVFLPRETRK